MGNQDVFSRIGQIGVVPVIAIESVEHALPLADALLRAELPVIEITFRTAAAEQVIRTLVEHRPELLVGAGTVLTLDNVRAAKDAGAQFALAPGTNPMVIEASASVGLPFMPGVCTPSDVEAALACGRTALKFFPAEASGGVPAIRSLWATYKHMGIHFVPTGGIKAENLSDYLKTPGVSAVGGTWLAKPEDLAEGRFDEIEKRCAAAVQTVAHARASAA